MMNKKTVSIIWIDDEIIRTKDAKYLESLRNSLKIKVYHPKDDKTEVLLSQLKSKRPDLFLIDYFLNENAELTRNKKYEAKAFTFSGRIREILPEYPIYVVTNDENKNRLGGIFRSEAQAAKSFFDKLLPLKDIQRNGHNILYFDALDYRLIRNTNRESIQSLFSLLKAPTSEHDRLKMVLPEELKRGIEYSQGNSIAFAKWVRDILLSVPGFLYDELYAATYLGMDKQFFQKLSPNFFKAKYAGIFSRTRQFLWWRSELTNILISNKKAIKAKETYPWQIANYVFNTPQKHISKCEVCGEDLPETVGINIKDDTDVKPVHYRCSSPHPLRKRELYFDEIRTFNI